MKIRASTFMYFFLLSFKKHGGGSESNTWEFIWCRIISFLGFSLWVFAADPIVFNPVLLQDHDVIIPKHTVYNCVCLDTQLKPMVIIQNTRGIWSLVLLPKKSDKATENILIVKYGHTHTHMDTVVRAHCIHDLSAGVPLPISFQ